MPMNSQRSLLNDVEPARVNRSLAVLKNMLGFAVDNEYLAGTHLPGSNSCRKSKNPHVS